MSKKEKIEDLFTNETTASLADFEKLVKGFRMMGMSDGAKIPLSYIVQALYKNVPINLQNNMNEIYREGYMQGYDDAKSAYKLYADQEEHLEEYKDEGESENDNSKEA